MQHNIRSFFYNSECIDSELSRKPSPQVLQVLPYHKTFGVSTTMINVDASEAFKHLSGPVAQLRRTLASNHKL